MTAILHWISIVYFYAVKNRPAQNGRDNNSPAHNLTLGYLVFLWQRMAWLPTAMPSETALGQGESSPYLGEPQSLILAIISPLSCWVSFWIGFLVIYACLHVSIFP